MDRDNEGYLIDPADWNQAIAQQLATEEQLTLDDEYWSVLNIMRGYYDDNKIAPDIRHVVKQLAEQQNITKKQAKKRLFELFPYGYVKQACKIAGMKRPRAWSTG